MIIHIINYINYLFKILYEKVIENKIFLINVDNKDIIKMLNKIFINIYK